MKHLLAGLALALVIGCGSDGGNAPTTGTIIFKVDASSCTGTAALDLFIDGSLVGTETLSAGASSKAYPATAGQHVVSARVANINSRVWPPITVTVPSGNSYTQLLLCT